MATARLHGNASPKPSISATAVSTLTPSGTISGPIPSPGTHAILDRSASLHLAPAAATSRR
ncbi:MAG: hypothetical protein AMK73_03845 [Planctomycetes bacterium SM23_32]|nr:MAG: hypothetical protein AMK73_03845 [Planctomycetes bacterium SM23_32]